MKTKKVFKSFVLTLTPKYVKKLLLKEFRKEQKALLEHVNLSYSQEGEDLLLRRIFGHKEDGFYIDVGAMHPLKYSNTYHYYCLGWHGINIDARPGSMELFNAKRPRDINIECAISDKEEQLTYYQFNDSALNTFSQNLSSDRNGKLNFRITEEIKLNTCRLETVLDENLPKDIEIDFLSVDVEGLELNVLKSNNWERFRPKIVVVEVLDNLSITEVLKQDTCVFLEALGYILFAKTYFSLFFRRNDFEFTDF